MRGLTVAASMVSAAVLVAVLQSGVAEVRAAGGGETATVVDEVQGLLFDDGSGHRQIVRLPALYVGRNGTVSPFHRQRTFAANWSASLMSPLRQQVQFHVEGAGHLILAINGKPVIDTEDREPFRTVSGMVELQKGTNAFEMKLLSVARGETFVRVSWSSSDFGREPIPPTAFVTRPLSTSGAMRSDEAVGRQIVAQLHCVRCHQPKQKFRGMPEINIRRATLTDAHERFKTGWLAQHIQNPQHFRPDSIMPRVLPAADDEKVSDDAWHIAAYLTDGEVPEPTTPDEALVTDGLTLFLDLGCIACHTTPDQSSDELDLDIERVLLQHVKLKYHPAALAAFLKNPHEHYPWRPMPNFELSDDEAMKLTAYLWHTASAKLSDNTPPTELSLQRGRELYETLGCMNCHDELDNSRLKATSFQDMRAHLLTQGSEGCLNPAKRGKAPQFVSLADDEKQAAAVTFLKLQRNIAALEHYTPAAFAARQIEELRCAACHAYDGRLDPWTKLEEQIAALMPEEAEDEADADGEGEGGEFDFDFGYGDEDAGEAAEEHVVDQSRPQLTWVGEKLQTDWMRKFIAGYLDYRPRPWLRSRMPKFPAQAEGLAHGLAAMHGYGPDAEKPAKQDAELAAIGKQLSGADSGFGCVQCHAIADREATSVFESQGVNFMYVRERLRKDYFDRWTMNPARIDPQTKMPKYADDEGRSPFTDILDGDAVKQYDAIWEYLKAGRKIEAP